MTFLKWIASTEIFWATHCTAIATWPGLAIGCAKKNKNWALEHLVALVRLVSRTFHCRTCHRSNFVAPNWTIRDVLVKITVRQSALALALLFVVVGPSCVKFPRTFRRKRLNSTWTSTRSSPSSRIDWAIYGPWPGSTLATIWCPSCRTTLLSIWPNFPVCKLAVSSFCRHVPKKLGQAWRFSFDFLIIGSSVITNYSACKGTPSLDYSLFAYCKFIFACLFIFECLFVDLAFGLSEIEI